jgi:hypothetical protein
MAFKKGKSGGKDAKFGKAHGTHSMSGLTKTHGGGKTSILTTTNVKALGSPGKK